MSVGTDYLMTHNNSNVTHLAVKQQAQTPAIQTPVLILNGVYHAVHVMCRLLPVFSQLASGALSL